MPNSCYPSASVVSFLKLTDFTNLPLNGEADNLTTARDSQYLLKVEKLAELKEDDMSTNKVIKQSAAFKELVDQLGSSGDQELIFTVVSELAVTQCTGKIIRQI